MKVLITGSSKFPVPAVQGGAVPNLIEELIQQQEVENKDERKEKKKEDGSDARRGGSYHRSEGRGGVCRDSQ